MESVLRLKNLFWSKKTSQTVTKNVREGSLASAPINQEYIVKKIETDNDEMRDFLFTLGCYEGESVTVISELADNYVISVKDARYSIDTNLAECILI